MAGVGSSRRRRGRRSVGEESVAGPCKPQKGVWLLFQCDGQPHKVFGCFCKSYWSVSHMSKSTWIRDFPGGPVSKTPCSQFRGFGLITGQGTRSHTLQLKTPHAPEKSCRPQLRPGKARQINIFKKKEMHTNQKCAVPQIFTHTNTHNRAGVGDGGVEPALRSKPEHEQHPGIPRPGTTTPGVTSMLTFNSRG